MLVYLLLSFCETPTTALAQTDFERLQTAKAIHSSEYNKVRDAIAKILDQRVSALQRQGNQPAVELLLAEKELFDQYGDLPSVTAPPHLKKLTTLASNLDKAFIKAREDATRQGRLNDARVIEKEHDVFRFGVAIRQTRATLLGSWKLKLGGSETTLTFYPNGTVFHSTESSKCNWKVDLPKKCIQVRPPRIQKDEDGDMINLPLNPGGTTGRSLAGGTFVVTKLK